MKNLIFILSLLSVMAKAQISFTYPPKQPFYKGGVEGFFRELHDILISKNLQPCTNKGEALTLKMAVYSDSTIKLVKETDENAVTANRCAYDLAATALPHLKNFLPATEKGKPIDAIARVTFYPDDLFENYKPGYVPQQENFTAPRIQGGNDPFRQKYLECFSSKLNPEEGSSKLVLMFEVDTAGEIQNVFIESNHRNDKFFKEMAYDCLNSAVGTLVPGAYKGTRIVRVMILPVVIPPSLISSSYR